MIAIAGQDVCRAGILASVFCFSFLIYQCELIPLEGISDLRPTHANIDVTEGLTAFTFDIFNQAVDVVLKFQRQMLSGKPLGRPEGIRRHAQRILVFALVQQLPRVAVTIEFD